MFLSSTKVQFKIMLKRREFQFAFLITLLYACVAFLYNISGFRMSKIYGGKDVLYYWDANSQIAYMDFHALFPLFQILYPFLIVLPFATSYADDYKNQLLPVYVTRVSRAKYYGSKLLAGFLGTALAIGVPLLFNLILCNVFFPHNNNTWLGPYPLENFSGILLGLNAGFKTAIPELSFARLWLVSPFLYNVVYLLLFSVFSGLLGSFVMGLSFCVKKWKIILFLPVFIVFQVLQTLDNQAFSKAILDENFSYDVACNPFVYVTPTARAGQNWLFMLVFCLIAVLLLLFFFWYGVKQELKSIQ